MKTITGPVKVSMSNLDDGADWTLVGFANDVKITQEDTSGDYRQWYFPTASVTLDDAVKAQKNLSVSFKMTGQTLKFIELAAGLPAGSLGKEESEHIRRIKRALEL
jgi:hypothetical protein